MGGSDGDSICSDVCVSCDLVLLLCMYCLFVAHVFSLYSLALLQPWLSMGRCSRSDDQPSSLTFRVENMPSLWLPGDWWAGGWTSLTVIR